MKPLAKLTEHDSSDVGCFGDNSLRYRSVIYIVNKDSQESHWNMQFGFGRFSVSYGTQMSGFIKDSVLVYDEAFNSEGLGLSSMSISPNDSLEFVIYSTARRTFTFNFYSQSLFDLIINQKDHNQDFGAFYCPISMSVSDYVNAFGYFGWMHTSGKLK